jgi:hypothetical protein
MAASSIVENVANQSTSANAKLLVCLPSLPAEVLEHVRANVTAAFLTETVLIASPEVIPGNDKQQSSLLSYTHPRSNFGWVLTAGDYLAAAELVLSTNVETVVLFGDHEISSALLEKLVTEIHTSNADLVLPRYTTNPTEGLVNSALLYPLTRVLFGVDARFPLPLNAAFSRGAAERLGSSANRLASNGAPDSLLWPVAEVAVAGLRVRQTDAGERSLPHPSESDFNSLFATVAGSLFADIEAKAAFWQRTRSFTPFSPAAASPPALEEAAEEIDPMVENFRLAYGNLQEIWSLVLPPQSLLALKRLSTAPPAAFAIAPQLWARIVYDFILAFHLRTINRGHLLGAFTSLYLAWVASYLRLASNSSSASSLVIAETESAFQLEKPYLLARWRWPDRFNP